MLADRVLSRKSDGQPFTRARCVLAFSCVLSRCAARVADTVADAHLLIRQFETLKSTVLNTAPGEGANSRAHDLPPDERALSLALSQALTAAILDEVAEPSRGTCWGAGI